MLDGAFVPIDRHTIRPDVKLTFDIYARSGEGNLALYCATGDMLSPEASEQNSPRGVEKLFIQKKDWTQYNLTVENNLDAILSDRTLNASLKAMLAYHSIFFVAELLFRAPRAELIRRYKQTIATTLKHVFDDNAVLHGLVGLTSFDFSIHNHSINVGIFSLGLLRAFLEDNDVPNLDEVASGFFLHDIGKSRVPVDILHKKGPLSKVEWLCMREHVGHGIKILEEYNLLTPESGIIISQHHERHDGSGYPRGLRGDSIHIHATICSIADAFDGLTSHRPFRKEFSSFQAMRIMKAEMFKNFDPIYFQKFVHLFSS